MLSRPIFGPADREAVAGAARKARNKRVIGIPKFVLPGKPELRNETDGAYLPVVACPHAKGRAEGLFILTGIRERGKRIALSKVAKADECILETRRGADRQAAFFPVVASCDEHVEVASHCISAGRALERRA